MDSDTLEDRLRALTGKASKAWGRLTDDDWKRVQGSFDRLAGTLQARYGVAREQAELQIRRFLARMTAPRKPLGRPRATPPTRGSTTTARERAAAGL